jgi:L-lactate transport
MWQQSYLLFGHGLPLSCALAALPVLTLIILLGWLRKPAWVASPCGLAVALLVALAGYRMPASIALSAAAHGAAFAIFPILWVIFWAITLFRVTVETGQSEIIKISIGRLTPDPRLQMLLIAVAFAGFLEGAAGFGAPVAIAATMLVGLGFSAFNASAACLLANTAPVAFGSIGIPLLTLALITGLPVNKLGIATAAICMPVAIIIPIYIVLAMGGRRATRGIWTPMLVCGIVFGGVQYLVARFLGPQLADILSALATIATLVVVIRLRRQPAELDLAFATRSLDSEDLHPIPSLAGHALQTDPTAAQVLRAWSPYGVLVLCVLLWGWKPLQSSLNIPTISFPWPWLHDAVLRMPPIVNAPSPYHAIFAFNWLAASGTACMVATILSAAMLRLSPRKFLHVLLSVARQLLLPTVVMTSVMGIAFVMNYSGATATLGLAFAATGAAFPFFSALLGWFGVFLTGSDTSANALFGNLQAVTAGRLGFSPVLMAAASASGGVMGKMISLQTIAIAAGATGLNQQEQSRLFRFTLRHSIVLAAFTGLVVLVLAYAGKLV